MFEDLVRVSDAVYSNLRGDIPAKLRLRYADLAHVNPRIVCVSLSGFGMTGPRRAEPAYDYILQGLAGWQSLTGDPDGPPTKSGLSVVDYSGGLVAALALLAGVHAARRDGVGCDCDTSLFDTAMNMLTYVASWALAPDGAYEPQRLASSAHPSIVPFQNFRTADGWIVIVCAKEKFWQRLVDVLGIAHVRDDPRFRGFAARRENRALVTSTLQDVLVTRTTAEWIAALTAAGVPCGPINDVRSALADPQTAARGLVTEVEHPVRHRAGSRARCASAKTARRTAVLRLDALITNANGRIGEHDLHASGGCSTRRASETVTARVARLRPREHRSAAQRAERSGSRT